MKAARRVKGLLVVALAMIAGCSSTVQVWSKTEPDYIEVLPTYAGEDVEAVLKAQNISSVCVQPPQEVEKACFVRESDISRISRKVMATPAALVNDSENVIKVTGAVLLLYVLPSSFYE
ncbi:MULTISPECIES: hypothetical protein [Vibrio]|uniref:hypothetical protein n=1 Tax=Vibrio TaxID=662 RepID=UPI000B258E02|nr:MULTISPECIES: hypothetical protein [Vibrio]